MKLFKKVLAGVAVAAAMATSAHAGLNNVDGVIWDPDSVSPLDFNATSALLRQFLSGITPTSTANGYGIISTMNGSNSFCPGCELTFVFSGYTQTSTAGSVPLGVVQNSYSGGTIDIYVDHAPNTAGGTSTDASKYSDGTLWLSLAGHANSAGNTFTGSIHYDLDTGLPTSLTGDGKLDVVGGEAANAFNTNTILAFGSNADFSFSTTFTDVADVLNASGSGTFTGNSVAVPEPESLALVGLGLLGLVGVRRRKSA